VASNMPSFIKKTSPHKYLPAEMSFCSFKPAALKIDFVVNKIMIAFQLTGWIDVMDSIIINT
jgi:hypothetical protein